MRIVNAALITFLLFSLSTAKPKPSLKAELIASEKRVIWEAVQKKEINVLRGAFTDDYLDVSDIGVFTKAQTLQLIPDLILRDYSLNDFKVIEIDANAAIITYEAIQHWTISGKEGSSHVRATSVWIKSRGRWMIKFHQESTIS